MKKYKQTQIIYGIKENFKDADDIIKILSQEIDDEDFKNNINRLIEGYKIEDIYFYLVGCLDNVELLHGLKQEQLPIGSKDNFKFQVPDFLCLYKDSSNKIQKLLIDVKSVNSDKKLFTVNKKQLKALKNYANILNCDFWYAIYWKKYNILTHIPYHIFETDYNYKIRFEDAYKRDCSSVLGDYTYLINTPFYVRSQFEKDYKGQDTIRNDEFGALTKEEISLDGDHFADINKLYSAAIDAIFKINMIEQNINGNKIIQLGAINNTYLIRLSHFILRHLAITHALELSLDEKYFSFSKTIITDLMSCIRAVKSNQIPT